MGFFSKFEGKMEDTLEGAADKMFDSPISPVQIAKKAEKQMKREKMVGAGKQFAPTLYTVLVNPEDDRRLFGYYPTLAGETETYLAAKASEQGLVMDGQPLVRFIVDDGLKRGKFDIIAEAVAAPIISQLRDEEMQRYGLAAPQGAPYNGYPQGQMAGRFQQQRQPQPQPQPYGNAGGYPAGSYAQGGAGMPMAGQQPYSGYDNEYDYAYNQPEQPGQPLPYASEDELLFGAGAAAGAGANAGAGAAGAAANAGGMSGMNGMGGNAPFGNQPGQINQPGQPNQLNQPGQPGQQFDQAVAASTMVFPGGQAAGAAMQQQAMPSLRARLIDEAANRPIDLAPTTLVIGRESKSNIVVQDINASRRHAELRPDPQGFWVITDLGSTNGTYVNGRRVSSQALQPGDHITIGMTNFLFSQA